MNSIFTIFAKEIISFT